MGKSRTKQISKQTEIADGPAPQGPALPSRRGRTARMARYGNSAMADALGQQGAPDAQSASSALTLARSGRRGPLPFQADMESRFGVDLHNVEALFGPEATQACELVGAEAFTVGNIIAFRDASPSSDVVRHEVTHVLQQGGDQQAMGPTPSALPSTTPGDPAEQEASDSHASSPQEGATGTQAGDRAFGRRDPVGQPVLARLPSRPSFGVNRPGLSKVSPVIQEGYDGSASVWVNDWDGWGASSWRRRWTVYDGEDRLVHESSYTWPQPELTFDKSMIARGKAGGKDKPWSAWIEVTHTLVPFGGDDPSNFPYAWTTFEVHETWDGMMADPDAILVEDEEEGAGQDADSPVASGGGSVVDYGSVTAMHEAYLRTIYDQGAKGITDTARQLVSDGVVSQKDVAGWAVDARNGLKAKVRADGNPILKKVFEQRNLTKYGDPIGPSYEQLYAKYAKQGLSAEEINARIIGSSGRANAAFNRWSGRLKWGGRVLLAIDICLAGARVWRAPEGMKVQTALSETFRIGGALALGAAGAKGGAALGGAIGALFGGAGAAPGAIIGGIIGGIAGAITGGWLGQAAIAKLYSMFPPSGIEFEGDFESGIQ